MFRDYVINAGMLVAFVSIIFQVFINTELDRSVSLKLKLMLGGIFGLQGIILMFTGVHLPNGTMTDFRNLALLLSASIGGCVSALITGFIILTARVLVFGFNESSFAAMFATPTITLLFCLISRLKIKAWHKWACSVFTAVVIASTAFSIVITDPVLKIRTIVSYCISLPLVAVFMYYYVAYMHGVTKSYRRYKQEAERDFLTGLCNARRFDEFYNGLALAGNEKMLSLLYIDIDFFKKVNDTYGHEDGDTVLADLGKLLSESCRNADMVSRNGGEEFSIVLVDCPAAQAVEIAERIRRMIEEHEFRISFDQKIKITVSIGIASFPDPINDFAIVKEKADEALYEAKRTGRNKVAVAR